MSHDIRLEPSPVTGAYDIPVVSPQHEDTPQIIGQRIRISLRTVLGEWRPNTSVGLPYIEWTGDPATTPTTVGAAARSAILATEGVISISRLTSEFVAASRAIAINATVIIEGASTPLSIEAEVDPVSGFVNFVAPLIAC